ncbi:MAG: ribulose-phosphate 3-epimerase [Clostridia bacterium]|nr:ribulose-phosphate 3-epimerase [Clostridia bacterium]
MNSISIAPSLLSADVLALGNEACRAKEAGADMLHVDVMDGHFVPNLAYNPAVVKALHGMGSLPMDVHLMMKRPDKFIDMFIQAGAARLSFHVEVLKGNRWLDDITVEKGLAISPGTPAGALFSYLDKIDFVILMGVEPGFGGQSILPGTTEKISQIRAKNQAIDIAVDGGVTLQNAPDLIRAGATTLISGAYLWGAEDMRTAIEELRCAR